MKLLLALALAACAPDIRPTPKAPTAPFPADLQEVVDRWAHLDIQVNTNIKTCGEINAYYDPATNTVELCQELLESVSRLVVRAIVSHEMAHAFQFKHKLHELPIPLEFEADELAFWMGKPDEVAALVAHYVARDFPVTDSHPSDHTRAAMLACLAEGVVMSDARAECRIYAQSSYDKWLAIRARPGA